MNKYTKLYNTAAEALEDTELVAPFFGYILDTKKKIYMREKYSKGTELIIREVSGGYNAVAKLDYLTFTCTGTENSAIGFTNSSSPNIEYNKNNEGWTNWGDESYATIEMTPGDVVKMRGNNPEGFSKLELLSYNSFIINSGKIQASGTIMSLIDKNNLANYVIPNKSCFSNLFNNCTSLITPPELPATELKESCYNYMFSKCSNLITAPTLPATILAKKCYYGMFRLCSKLTETPELPAEVLRDNCYNSMFELCSDLITANKMHFNSFTNGEIDFCRHMFNGCSKLVNVQEELYPTILKKNCYAYMFKSCIGLITAPELPATELADSCYYGLFEGCTNLRVAPELHATTLKNDCYAYMFYGCSSLHVAPELPAMELAIRCYQSMFLNCTSLTTAPELPATTLKDWCYSRMFFFCSSLNYIKCLATDISADSCTTSWVGGVNASGTFVKSLEMESWTTGVDGIPSGWAVQGDDPRIVDLGLSVKWAKCNIGAEHTYDYGKYFQWGDTIGYTGDDAKAHSTWNTCPFNNGSSTYDSTYFLANKSTWVDTENILRPDYDAAHVAYGGNWRLPKKSEIEELVTTFFTWNEDEEYYVYKEGWSEWITNYQESGINGILIHGQGQYSGNDLFIPASGIISYGAIDGVGSVINMWSSSLHPDYLDVAFGIGGSQEMISIGNGSRSFGSTLRGVYSNS